VGDVSSAILGAEIMAVGRNTNYWAYLRANDGFLMNSGSTGNYSPSADGILQWDCDQYYEYRTDGRQQYEGWGIGDLGGDGREELWTVSGNTLNIKFNTTTCSSVPSRNANRHYRQDIQVYGSGYGVRYMIPQVLP